MQLCLWSGTSGCMSYTLQIAIISCSFMMSFIDVCVCCFSSSQKCAAGYFRDRSGFFLGRCVPCECNGLADECEDGTGKCLVRDTLDPSAPIRDFMTTGLHETPTHTSGVSHRSIRV